MSTQYFSGQVMGLRGPGLTAAQQAQIDAIATALPNKADTTDVLLRDGLQPATGPLVMGGNPIKDLPYIATDGGDAISKAQFDQESLARYNADNAEAEARADADDALADRISSSETAILQRQGRPGDAPSRMTATIAGPAAAGAPAPGATVITDDGGAAQLVTGAGIVALRERIALRQGQVIRARFTVQRLTDPTDPAGDTVRLAVQALNKNKVALGSPRIVQDIVLTVANGLHHATATFAFSGADFTWPATALYATVYVQTYGLDGGTAISLIDWEDITGLVEVAADASAAVASETSRATSVEGVLANRATAIEQTHRVDLALDLKGWTRAQTQFSAAEAPSDAVTSLVSTSKGRAIRLTGFAMLAKRSVSIVEPGVKYYLTFSFGRGVDDPADNNVLPRIACFDGNGTYLGLVLLPSQNIAAGSAAASLTVSVGDGTSGATYGLLANTRYIRPYISGATSATTGAIDLYRITDPSPVDRSDIAAINSAIAGVPYLPRNTDVFATSNKPFFFDYRGVHNSGYARGIYFSTSLSFRKGASGTYTTVTVANEAAPDMPGYARIQVPTSISAYQCYLDTNDNTVKFALFSGLPVEGANIWPLFVVQGATVSMAHVDVQRLETGWLPRASKPLIASKDGILQVPQIYCNTGYFGTYATADKYRTIPSFGTSSAQALCFDVPKAIAAEAAWLAANPGDTVGAKEAGDAAGFVIVNNPAWPDSPVMKVVAYGFGGLYSAADGLSIVGAVPGGSTANVMGIGQNGIESAVIFSNCAVVDVTNADALAMGFTRALVSTADPASARAFYGCNFASAVSFGQVFFRCWVVTDVDNDFPPVQCYGFTASGNVSLGYATMEKQIGPRFASFIFQAPVPAGITLTGAWAGINYQNRGECQLMGVQTSPARPGPTYIFPEDFAVATVNSSTYVPPATVDLLLPDDFYVIEGRGLPFYPEQVIEAQTEGLGLTIASEAVDEANGRKPITDPKELFSGSFGGSARLVARTAMGNQANLKGLSINVHKAPASALVGKTVPLLVIGDSLSATYGLAPAIKAKLEYLGATVQMIGTLTADDRTINGGTASRATVGEGRGSRKTSDFTNASVNNPPFDTKLMSPITDFSTYLAQANGNPIPLNPFARPAEAGDLEAHVCNEHIFDLGWYLTGTGQAAPRYVLLVFGTNDEGVYGAPDDENSVYNNLKIIIERIWAYDPAIDIMISLETNSWSAVGFTRWVNEKRRGNKRKLQLIREKATSRLVGLSWMAHQNRHAGWIYDASGSADPITGVVSLTCTDPHHESFIGAEQMAEVVVARIAAREAGL